MKTTLRWLVLILAVPAIGYTLWIVNLNMIGPSTRLAKLQAVTAERGADGRRYVYLGDEFRATYTVVRHRINGNCLIDLRRWFEDVGGNTPGKRRMISHVQLQFIGQDEVLEASFPVPPLRLRLQFEAGEDNKPRPDRPLLEPGVDEQVVDLLITGRYYCNFIDYIWPRYLQGGMRPNETGRDRIVLKRSRPE